MAGKQTPRRHIATQRLSLRSRNIDEVALYFRELQQFSSTQDTLVPSLLVKALPGDTIAKNKEPIDSGRTAGANVSDNETPQIKLNYDPNAKRKPGQVLKLHTTYKELTSKDGAPFGWVDPPKPKSPEEVQQLLEEARQSIQNRTPLFLRRYERNRDGSLSGRVAEEIRLKTLGPKIGQTVGSISTGAFRAAGGWIDAAGKLRCPPGTPNANQFTDVDMSNCFAVGPAAAKRGLARIRKLFEDISREGDELQKYGRRLSPQELEQQEAFEKGRSAITSKERVAEVAKAHTDRLRQLVKDAGLDFDDSVEGGNYDFIMSMRDSFPAGPEGEKQFMDFVFGTTKADSVDYDTKSSGGILADVLGLNPENATGFQWEGERSIENIKPNLERYDKLIRQQLASFLPEPIQRALNDPNADPELKQAAQQLLDTVRKRHHLAQREFLGATLTFKDKYPEAFERIGQIRAMTVADINEGEKWTELEGSTRPDLDNNGNISATVSFSAMQIALTTPLGRLDTLINPEDTSAWHLDVGDAGSEAQKNRDLAKYIQDITDAFIFNDSVTTTTFANQMSMARLADATSDDSIIGRARHVAFHELGHVVQYHAAQQKVIDQWKKSGSFKAVVVDQNGKLVGVREFTDPPSTWTNSMWMDAIMTTHNYGRLAGLDFPPTGAVRFEESMLHLLTGRYYAEEIYKAKRDGDKFKALNRAISEGMTELWAQREMGMVEGSLVDEALAYMDPPKLTYVKTTDIPYDAPPARTSEDVVLPDELDIPTAPASPSEPRDGAGTTIIYNGPVYNGPVNITINNGPGVASEMDAPSTTVDKPNVDASGRATPKAITWSDVEGHIYMDDDTQWSPTQAHNIEIEQNPEEVRRFVDAAFGLGPDEGGPDPTDELGSLRQKKDAYWKMTPEQLDARFEKLRSEYEALRDKSMSEPLTSEEQARMWLAIKGMRQVLDVNTRRSKMSDAELAKYKAKGFNPQPGKYMRKVDSVDKPGQSRWRQYALDRRKSRGFGDIEEVDDDELTHWSREIGDHAGDVAGGADGFDGSARQYDPTSVRTKKTLSSREKRKRSPEYTPTEEEISKATLADDPELVGKRKIDEVASRATPEQKKVIEQSDKVDSDPLFGGVASHSSRSSSKGMESLIDKSARARQKNAQVPRQPGQQAPSEADYLDNSFKNTALPLMDLFDASATDEDMSIVAAIDIGDDLRPGHVIEHGGPLRGLLVPHDSSESFNIASPQGSQRAIITIPKGAKALHAKNSHNGATDGVLIPPGSLEVVSVDPDGRIILMPSHQKTSHEFISDAISAIDSVKAPSGSPAWSEKRILKRMLIDERANRKIPARSVRGQSGDPAARAKNDVRASSINKGFEKTGSNFFGTTVQSLDGTMNSGSSAATMSRAIKHSDSTVAIRSSVSDLKSSIDDPSFIASLGEDIPEDLLDLVRDTSPEELMSMIDNAVFRFHEGFDDRPRIALDAKQYAEFVETGRLSNFVEKKPNSIASEMQRSFELENGVSNTVPDSSRSHFGYLVHSTSQKEIQDYLDELPDDGLIREAKYFSSAKDINQFGDIHSGDKTIELVLTPEVAKRTAYTKGNPMDGALVPTPLLSTNRDEVRSAIVNNLDGSRSRQEISKDILQTLEMANSKNMSGYGSGISRSSRSSSARSSAPVYEAVIGGEVNANDVGELKFDISQLERVSIDADDFGGRQQLLGDLRDAGITSNTEEILDILLSGDLDQLPKEAEFLRVPFARMRAHRAAVDYQKKHATKIVVTNPEGVDLTSVDALTNLPHIDPNADDATRLSERLRYDIYGAKLRTLEPGRERSAYRKYGKMPVSRPHAIVERDGPTVPGQPVTVGGVVGSRPVKKEKIDAFLGKRNREGRHSIFGQGDPNWEDSSYAIVEYNADTQELRTVDKNGEIRIIKDVDALEAIQLSQQIDDDGGFDTIDNGIERLLERTPSRIVTGEDGSNPKPADVAQRDKIISDAEAEVSQVIDNIDKSPSGDIWDRPLDPLATPLRPFQPRMGSSYTLTPRSLDYVDQLEPNPIDDDYGIKKRRVVSYLMDNGSVIRDEGDAVLDAKKDGLRIVKRIVDTEDERVRTYVKSTGKTADMPEDMTSSEIPNILEGARLDGANVRFMYNGKMRTFQPGRIWKNKKTGKTNVTGYDVDRGEKDITYSLDKISGVPGSTSSRSRRDGGIRPEQRDGLRSRIARRASRGSRGTRTETRATRDRRVQQLFKDAVQLGDASDGNSGLHRLSDSELLERFDAQRTGRESLIDGTPIYEVNDVNSAAALLAAGYHVQLGEGAVPEQLVGASAQLQKDIDAIIPELRKSLKRDDAAFGTIDTCRLYVGGTNVFCEGGLGTARADMPQLSGRAKGDDARVVGAMKNGLVKTSWKPGRRSADGKLSPLSAEEQARFDELKSRHAAPGKDGSLSPVELDEFYGLVDWNDTEADMVPQFREYVARVTGRDDAIVRTEGILPSSLAASQGQIQMAKTGGMVISMRNHDYSFSKFMAEQFPDVAPGSDEYYDYRDAWLYKGTLPDGSPISFQMFNTDGQLIDKDGNVIPDGQKAFVASGKPWFTDGSIISTKDGFVVDGHHRWASFMAYNEGKSAREQLRISSEVMDMPIDDALSIGKVMQDHWGIKPAVLGQETFFAGDGRSAPSMTADAFAGEMAELENDLGSKLNKARDLYFKKEGFGGTVERRVGTTGSGGVRVSSSSRSSARSGREGSPSERITSVLSSRSSTSASKTKGAADIFDEVSGLDGNGLHGLDDNALESRFGISRTGELSAADGKPLYRVEDTETAAALMAAGYNVELGSRARAFKSKLSNKKLQEQINEYLSKRDDLTPAQRAAYTIDACRMFVKGSNIFCGKNIGTRRMDMPQLSGRAKGDDSVAMQAGKAGLAKVDWKPGKRDANGVKTDLTPDEMKEFETLKKKHASPKGPGSLTDAEKERFYSLVDWNDTEIDMVPQFLDHVRRVKGDGAVTELTGVRPDNYSASQGQIQAEKVTGMVEGIKENYETFVAWAESQGAKRGSKRFKELRQQFLSGELDDQIPILDKDGNQKIKDGKPQFASAWWAKGSIITAKDGYVVDGHHRWAAVLTMNMDLPKDEQLTLNTVELNTSIFESLSLGKAFQDSIGIKEAKLGEEDMFVPNPNAATIDADGLAAHIQDHENNLQDKLTDIADRGIYKPQGAIEVNNPKSFEEGLQFIEQRVGSGAGRGAGPRVISGKRQSGRDTTPVSRRGSATSGSGFSSRSSSGSFSDDYPMMSQLDIDPRPTSSDSDASYKRVEAERLLNGASKSELRRSEGIAARAIEDIENNRNQAIEQISSILGSREAYDDLMDFEKPTPRSWTDLSEERRNEIADILQRANEFEAERKDRAKGEIFEMREKTRRARSESIEEARRVSSRNASARSSRSAAQTRGDAARKAVPVERVANRLSDAFLNRGTAGVMSQLRSMLKNDSSSWAIDYAKERGYISDSQAKILKKLSKGIVRRFINPSLAKRRSKRKTSNNRAGRMTKSAFFDNLRSNTILVGD